MIFNAKENKSKKPADMAKEWQDYWNVLFKKKNIENPIFKTKLIYNSDEFSSSEKTPAVSFFENEVNSIHNIYLEFCNWDNNSYFSGERRLYALDSKVSLDLFVKRVSQYTTYAIQLKDLRLVNVTSISSTIPLIESNMVVAETNLVFDDNKDDEHLSKMTMRDNYCITQNIPMSNKEWLNNLIKEGIKHGIKN